MNVVDDFAAVQISRCSTGSCYWALLHFLKQNIVRGLPSFVEQEVTTVYQDFVILSGLNRNSGN